jgi:hypothetical protein
MLMVAAMMRTRWEHAKFRELLPSTGLVGYLTALPRTEVEDEGSD